MDKSIVSCCCFFKKLPNYFQGVMHHFTFPHEHCVKHSVLHFLTKVGAATVSHFSSPDWCAVTSSHTHSLHSRFTRPPSVVMLKTSPCEYLPSCISLSEIPFMCFVHFLTGLPSFLIVEFGEFLLDSGDEFLVR